MIIIFLFLSGSFECVSVFVVFFVSICLFLNSSFHSGSMTLLWSNSTNWVFGISAMVTFSVRLAPRSTLAPCGCNFNIVKTSPTTTWGKWRGHVLGGFERGKWRGDEREVLPNRSSCGTLLYVVRWVVDNPNYLLSLSKGEHKNIWGLNWSLWVFSMHFLHFRFHAKICPALKQYNDTFFWSFVKTNEVWTAAVTFVKVLSRQLLNLKQL